MELTAATNATESSSLAIAVPATVPSTTVLMSSVARTSVIVFGIFGNLLALFILHRARSSSNKKIVFMLRCLAAHDCLALVCMLVLPIAKNKWPRSENNVWMCRCKLLQWYFMCGSGNVALVMAVDRWLAFTKPFFYQTHISFCLLKRMMVILLLEVLCLVCAPIIGFGVYWDEKSSTCLNFTDYKTTLDKLYIYLHFSHGIIVCFTAMFMNLAVMNVLYRKESLLNNHNGLTRHFNRGPSLTCNAPTKDEKSLAWIMLLMCVGGVICLVPNVLAIMLNTLIADKSSMMEFNMATDLLLVIHFTLDPCLNVLHHWKLVKSVCSRSQNKNNGFINGSSSVSRSSSLRTTNKVYL